MVALTELQFIFSSTYLTFLIDGCPVDFDNSLIGIFIPLAVAHLAVRPAWPDVVSVSEAEGINSSVNCSCGLNVCLGPRRRWLGECAVKGI